MQNYCNPTYRCHYTVMDDPKAQGVINRINLFVARAMKARQELQAARAARNERQRDIYQGDEIASRLTERIEAAAAK